MKIELLEDFKHDDGTGLQVLRAGEVRVVGDPLGRTLCDMGMAKDVAGTHPTGKRDVHKTYRVQPETASSGHTVGEG